MITITCKKREGGRERESEIGKNMKEKYEINKYEVNKYEIKYNMKDGVFFLTCWSHQLWYECQ